MRMVNGPQTKQYHIKYEIQGLLCEAQYGGKVHLSAADSVTLHEPLGLCRGKKDHHNCFLKTVMKKKL